MDFRKQKLGIVMIFISMSALNAEDGGVCVDGTDEKSLLLAKALWDAERIQDLRVEVRSEVIMAEVEGEKHLASTFESTAHGEVVGQSLIIRRDGTTTCVFGRFD